jgi:hypothetical protein
MGLWCTNRSPKPISSPIIRGLAPATCSRVTLSDLKTLLETGETLVPA